MMPNDNGSHRLDRIERALELLIEDHVRFSDEHKQLLTAQIVLTGNMTTLAESQQRTDQSLAALAVKVEDLADKLNGLIQIVDGIVRNPPEAPPAPA